MPHLASANGAKHRQHLLLRIHQRVVLPEHEQLMRVTGADHRQTALLRHTFCLPVEIQPPDMHVADFHRIPQVHVLEKLPPQTLRHWIQRMRRDHQPRLALGLLPRAQLLERVDAVHLVLRDVQAQHLPPLHKHLTTGDQQYPPLPRKRRHRRIVQHLSMKRERQHIELQRRRLLDQLLRAVVAAIQRILARVDMKIAFQHRLSH